MTVEEMVRITIIAIFILLFVILGIVFMKGKGNSLIAGYNTMPQEEKKKYNSIALSKCIGKMMFALSFIMLFWNVSIIYDVNWLFNLGIILLIGIVVYTIIYVNTGNRFKKQHDSVNEAK